MITTTTERAFAFPAIAEEGQASETANEPRNTNLASPRPVTADGGASAKSESRDLESTLLNVYCCVSIGSPAAHGLDGRFV